MADIYSLSFSFDNGFLSVSSDKGTVHIFAIRDVKMNRKTTIPNVFNDAYGDICNFKADNDWPCVCAFSDVNHIVAGSFTGTFHKYIFSTDRGCNREEFDLYLDGIDGTDF